MNPEIAMALARQHHRDLAGAASRHRRYRRHPGRTSPRLPRWHVTWTRMAPGEGAGPGRPRSSWMIIISPGRPG